MESKKQSTRLVAVLVAVAFVAVVVVNALANILPLNGVNTGVLSDEIPNLFVPAGLTFSIWGLIYLLLAAYSIAVIMEAFGKKPTGGWNVRDGLIFIANAVLNVGWIFAWHWRLIPLSFVLMLGILATLVLLMEANHGRRELLAKLPPVRAFVLRAPILVYLGWICVATIANVTALLVTLGWNGFGLGEPFWAVAMIVAGLAVGAALLFLRNAYASALVVVWAYAGIVIKRGQVDGGGPVYVAALVAALAIAAAVVVRFVVSRRKAT